MNPQFFFSLFVLAACIVVLFALALIMAFRFKQRELQHRERMVALEKGAPLPILTEPAASQSASLLLRGMRWLFSGIALVIFLLALTLSPQREISASVRVQNANYAKNSGATEEQVREIMNDRQERGMPAGFSLIGLIPIGVGLAYLIAYRKESGVRGS
jgi:lysylphosphatidylglycerol synthetase-like protein (DUF2156 family)